MKTTIYAAIALLLGLTACGQNTAPTVNQTTKPSANQTAAPTATTADKPKIKTGSGTGAVTKINLELGSVALDHEEIKGIMPAMQGMEFYVSDKKMLDGLKIGDRVNFVLEDDAGAERIIEIKKK